MHGDTTHQQGQDGPPTGRPRASWVIGRSAASWPQVDPALLATDTVTCVIQVQGKVRARLEVPPGIDEKELRSRALAEESVVRALAGREIAKVIIRAPKLVSIVPR